MEVEFYSKKTSIRIFFTNDERDEGWKSWKTHRKVYEHKRVEYRSYFLSELCKLRNFTATLKVVKLIVKICVA